MGCGCNARRNPTPPRGMREIAYATKVQGWPVHVLAWIDTDGRGYELALSPYGHSVAFAHGKLHDKAATRRGDYVVDGKLVRGKIEIDDAGWRKMGVAGRLVLDQMWRNLLAKMAKVRANPVPEDHGEEVDGDMQAEIDEAFRTLPVTVYRGGGKARRRR